MKFPEKIDLLMNKNLIKSIRQLAIESNVPYTTLRDYYANEERLNKANIEHIKKIAKHLGCTIDYLVFDDITTITPVRTKSIKDFDLDSLYKKSKDKLNDTEIDIIKHSMLRAIDRDNEKSIEEKEKVAL